MRMYQRPKYAKRIKLKGKRVILEGFASRPRKRCHIPHARIAWGHNPLWLLAASEQQRAER